MQLSRRQLLVHGAGAGVLARWLPLLAARADAARQERVLVVLHLQGGNDALNMVVPHRQDRYYVLRPTLALKRSALHALDDDHGLHPAMNDLAALYAEGRLTVVQAVGPPHPDRSHFRATEIWHTGCPLGPSPGIGWLGRLSDQIWQREPGSMPALHVGDDEVPLALVGREYVAPSVSAELGLQLAELEGLDAARAGLLDASDGAGDVAFLRDVARGAYRAVERMERATERPDPVSYPDLPLARRLQRIARLLEGGFETRVFFATLSGFDTHARQAAQHASLLEQLSRSLGAFERHLAAAGLSERVATVVFSEFGRRAAENASRGTDHGAAAPVLVLGGPGRGGMRGSAPDLEALEDGDVPFQADLRSLWSTFEQEWMGLAPSSAFPPLAL